MKQILRKHGRNHKAGGTDPIWDGDPWRFNVENLGGSGYVEFGDGVDLDLVHGGSGDPLAVGGTWGAAFEDASGDGLLVGSTTTLLLKSAADWNAEAPNFAFNVGTQFYTFLAIGSSFTIYDHSLDPLLDITEAGQINLYPGSSGLSVTSAGPIELTTSTSPLTLDVNGKTFEFRDDGTIHGPTGGSIVWDL